MLRSAPGIALAVALVVALAPSRAAAQSFPIRAPSESRAVAATRVPGRELLWPEDTPPEAMRHPALLRGHDMGLIMVGVLGLSIGMTLGHVIAGNDLWRGNCVSFRFGTHVQCGAAYLSFIPFGGSVAVGFVHLSGDAVDGGWSVLGTAALVPQILGLVLLLVGIHGFTEDLTSLDDRLTVRVDPLISPDVLGLTLTVAS